MPSHGRPHRLSVTLALGASAITALALLVIAFLDEGLPFWMVLLVIGIVGLGTYSLAVARLRRRITASGKAVQEIQQGRFEPIPTDNTAANPDELGTLIRQINESGHSMLQQQEDRERIEHYRREFLGNVSHELKTPIFSIRGFAETLLEGALEDETVRRSFVEKIQRNAQRLGNLADDLGEVARIEMGELSMTIQPFNLLQVVGDVTESIEPLASTLSVTVRHTLGSDLPLVNGDRERIRQVLSNLVDNAVKYNNPGGHVEIGARFLPDGLVKVSIVDDGIGIAPDHIDRLTERFFRVDTSRSRSQGGTGLGLAIVKHILGAHGSQLQVHSTPGQGSTFGFSLPAVT